MKTEAFDNGKDITEALDFSKAARPGRAQRRVNVDFPEWMILSLDKEADRLAYKFRSYRSMPLLICVNLRNLLI